MQIRRRDRRFLRRGIVRVRSVGDSRRTRQNRRILLRAAEGSSGAAMSDIGGKQPVCSRAAIVIDGRSFRGRGRGPRAASLVESCLSLFGSSECN